MKSDFAKVVPSNGLNGKTVPYEWGPDDIVLLEMSRVAK